MQFLKDIREHHLKDFETEAMDEIHRFMEFLEKRFAPPTDAVPGPKPDPVGVEITPTPIIPDTTSVEATSEVVPEAEVVEEEPVEEESSVIAKVAPTNLTCQPKGK